MSHIRHTPGETTTTTTTTLTNPLTKLSQIQTNINSLQQILSHSVNTNTPLSQPQLNLISSQITSSIQSTIHTAKSLISIPIQQSTPVKNDDDQIIEIDAVELLAEHVHLCEICGKGFKRDANLRMHMRAHGNRFKTIQALSKPEEDKLLLGKNARFSCPFVGCNRNKLHRKFRALKSVICLRNHFKRSHCAKMFPCEKCKNKSFSVVGDLKAHLKVCGERERKWRCCCGTSFSRKDKLFGHVALFEGHMPVIMEEDEQEEKGKAVIETDELKDLDMERIFDGCGEMDECEWFSSPVATGMEEFFNF